MWKLTLNNQSYTFEEIKKNNFSGVSDYEKTTLSFCSEWLNGKKTFLIYTSGSTGEPKPIEISRKQMTTSAAMTAAALNLKAGYKSLICLNTEFIAGKMMLVRGFESGMEMTIIPPSSNPLKEFPEETIFDFAAFVPLQIENIIRETPEKRIILERMKAIIIGGVNINPSLEVALQKISAPVYHTFGMTETVSHIALKRLNGNERSEYFKTLNEVKISQDERACLIIESPLSDHPLITNDIVEIIDQSHFKWIGRIDNIINSGGIKIQAEKVEAALQKILHQLNLTIRYFVCGIPHIEFGEIVAVVYEGEELEKEKIEEIKNNLKAIISKYELPKLFLAIGKFPETPTGKIDRKTIREKIS
jgi:o-succinylbenzoate---CoA ligase